MGYGIKQGFLRRSAAARVSSQAGRQRLAYGIGQIAGIGGLVVRQQATHALPHLFLIHRTAGGGILQHGVTAQRQLAVFFD